MATKEQLEKALVAANAAGNKEHASLFAKELIKLRNAPQARVVENADTRGNIAQQLLQGGAMNFGDESMGSIANVYAKFMSMLDENAVSGITGKNDYDAINQHTAIQSVRDDLKSFEERNPGTALGAQVAGQLVTGVAGGAKLLGSGLVKNSPGMVKALSIPALAGAEGFVMGAGSKEGFEERMKEGAMQGATAAAMAPMFMWGGRKIAEKFLKKPATQLQQFLTPTEDIETLAAKATNFYAKADKSGIRINKDHYKTFKDALIKGIDNKGAKHNVKKQIVGALEELDALENPSYRDLEKAKEMLYYAKKNPSNAVRDAAENISHSIDEFVDTLKFGQITGNPGESPMDLADNLKRARNLWHRKAQAETLDMVEEVARINAAVGDGDMDKAIRGQIGGILKSRNKMRGLDPEVIKGLDTILSGDKSKTILRSIAGVSPGESTRRGLLPMLGAALGGFAITGGNPLGLLAGVMPGAVGGIASKMAGRHSGKALDKLRQGVINPDQLKVGDVMRGLMEGSAEDFLPGLRPLLGASSAAGLVTVGDNKNDIKTQLEILMEEYAARKMAEENK